MMTTGVPCRCDATRDSDCVCEHRVYHVASMRYVATTSGQRDAGMVAAALNLTGAEEYAVATPACRCRYEWEEGRCILAEHDPRDRCEVSP